MATRKRSKREEDALRWRALGAWVKYDAPYHPLEEVHVAIIEIEDGRAFVTITKGKRLLAAFRIRSDGQLRRMRRPPRELRGEDED